MKAEEIVKKIQSLLKEGDVDHKALLKLSSELSKLDPNFQRFFIDAKTLLHLGRDSIKDHTTALIELVKNSYDADAQNVVVEILCENQNDLIRVSDNGFGMTQEELTNNWLRIGFSNKRVSKVSGLGRRKTGEKGIGRISTDRLGAKLELRSKTEKGSIVGLRVNWDDFDTEGKDVFDIDVELFKPEKIDIPLLKGNPSPSGTEITITNLRQPWSKSNIKKIRGEENLSKSWKQVTRRTIQYHSTDAAGYKGGENLFYSVEGIGSGTWGLRNFLSDKGLSAEEDRGFPEGQAKYREHLYRERNSSLVKMAKHKFKEKNGSLYCEVCGFDFERTYGEVGSDFIEAHHSTPISEMKLDSETKVQDLIMVCSNCHRMLHRKRPWITKADLKSLLV